MSWNQEQWGTEYEWVRAGIFRLFISRSSPRRNSPFVGYVHVGRGDDDVKTRLSDRSVDAAAAKYATLMAFRDKLREALAQVEQMLMETELLGEDEP